jgi:hypothetical protein
MKQRSLDDTYYRRTAQLEKCAANQRNTILSAFHGQAELARRTGIVFDRKIPETVGCD